jgi:hypothetical protein
MKSKTAKKLAECGNVRVYEDYSGRGMYGLTTTGVVGSHTDLYNAVECILRGENNKDITPEQFIDEFRSDSMGMDFIWY